MMGLHMCAPTRWVSRYYSQGPQYVGLEPLTITYTLGYYSHDEAGAGAHADNCSLGIHISLGIHTP